MTAGANDLVVRCQRLAPIALSAAIKFDAAAAQARFRGPDGRWISTPAATALLHVRIEEPAGLPEGSQWLEVLVRKRGTAHPAVLIDLTEWVARQGDLARAKLPKRRVRSGRPGFAPRTDRAARPRHESRCPATATGASRLVVAWERSGGGCTLAGARAVKG
jgi:hypothetical protein